MQKLIASITLILLFTPYLYASDDMEPLTIEMSDPKVRITIPGMPKMDMALHPMNEHEPSLRLLGSNGETSISIITQEIDGVNTPMLCATEIANTIIALDSVTRDQVFLGRANEQTFLIIYGVPMEQSVLLNTHIISANETSGCIEAHVSKISTSDTDIEPWFNEFGDSKIETL
jgi:hypothetical protein